MGEDDPGGDWLAGGSYLVARRSSMAIEPWDRTSLREQEALVGRDRAEGAPLSGGTERTEPDFELQGRAGPLVPTASHVRLAHPGSTTSSGYCGAYSFTDDAEALGRLDADVLVVAFVRDPGRHYVPMQTRLSRGDGLLEYLQHTGSGLWAVPPGVTGETDWIGRSLLGRGRAPGGRLETMTTPAVPTYTLSDGSEIPAIGFGTYPLRGEEGVEAMLSAVEVGYRLLDTALNYENEREVGEVVRQCGVPREELFVTSKLPGRHHAYDDAIASVEGSLERLGLDYLDLHLIHWPNPSVGRYVEAWQALVDLRERGLVRSVGVSNFTPEHLSDVIAATGVTPAVNQVELHPRFPQEQLRQVHDELVIRTEAWSPMGKRRAPLSEPAVLAAADRLGVTPGQVILRWHVQLGSLPIPKSANPERQAANLDVFSFELTDAEVDALSTLADPDGRLFGGDPDSHEEM